MGSEKSTAIVLRVTDFSESSCVVVLMTRDFGKITALAKGARRPKGPFEAAIDVLAICRIVFLHKSSQAMDLLTEAKLERRFRSSATDLKRLYAAYYIVELLKNLTEENDPHPDLFDLAYETIARIDDPSFDEGLLNEVLLRFELKSLQILGHLPMLTKCVECGRERTTQNRVSFGLQAGGLLCHGCRKGKQNVVSLSPDAINLLLEIATNSRTKHPEPDARPSAPPGTMLLKEDNKLNKTTNGKTELATKQLTQNLRPKCLNEVRGLMNNYLTHLLGYPPRLHKYLKNI